MRFDLIRMFSFFFFLFYLQVEWQKNDELVSSLTDDQLDTRADLIINEARLSDSGNYTCLASNVVAKRRSATAPVIVYGTPATTRPHRNNVYTAH